MTGIPVCTNTEVCAVVGRICAVEIANHDQAFWAVASFIDTLLKWKMKLEVKDGKQKEIQRKFKLEAVRMVRERGVSVLGVSVSLQQS